MLLIFVCEDNRESEKFMGNVQQTKEKCSSLLSRVSFKHYAVVFTPPNPPFGKLLFLIGALLLLIVSTSVCERVCVSEWGMYLYSVCNLPGC